MNREYNEHDIITFDTEVLGENVELSGTIIHKYNSDNYEVEFQVNGKIYTGIINNNEIK